MKNLSQYIKENLNNFIFEDESNIFSTLIDLYKNDKGEEFIKTCKEYTEKNKTLNKFQKLKLAKTKNGVAITYLKGDGSNNPEAGAMLLKAGDDDWFTLECNNDDYSFDSANNDDELCTTLAMKFDVCWFNDVPEGVIEFFKEVKKNIEKENKDRNKQKG